MTIVTKRAALALLVALLVSGGVRAERVVLVSPTAPDPELLETQNRLRGELTMQGFEVITQSSAGTTTPDSLVVSAEREGAVASVSFVRSAEGTSIDIWVSDRVTGKVTVRTIAANREDAPSVLALRAVELLKASLREFVDEQPPRDIVGAHRERLRPRAEQWVRTRAPEQAEAHWALAPGLFFLTPLRDPRPALGVALALQRRSSNGWYVGLLAGTSLSESQFETEVATAQLSYALLGAEAGYRLFAQGRLAVDVQGTAGALHLSAHSNASTPWRAQDADAWVAAIGPGLALGWQLGTVLSLTGEARCLFLTPEPVVQIAGRLFPLQSPLLFASAGLQVRF